MDNNQILKELEAAAQILLAPPNLVSSEQRHSAESVFLEFRKTNTPYLLCKQILETNTVDYVLFESVGLIKIALVREWNLIAKDDFNSVKEYLLHYVVNKPTLAPFVRERIFQVIAIMVKKLSAENSEQNVTTLLNQVESMVMNGDLQRKLLGCGIISALMQEFTVSTKSSDIGLQYNIHLSIKREFESTHLRRIFKFCTTALSELTKEKPPEVLLPLIKHLLSIIEGVLTWEFTYASSLVTILVSTDKSSGNETIDLSIIQLFFTIYSTVRTNLGLAHYARSCLVQLSNINEVSNNNEDRLQYLSIYMQEFLKLVSYIDMIDQEAFSIANIIDNLVRYLLPNLTKVETNVSNSFMEEIIRLTRIFAEGAAQEESVCSNDYLYMEAFDKILKTWTSILYQDNTLLLTEYHEQLSIQIFDIYLKSKLSPPDGFRVTSKKECEEEISEIEEDDRSKYDSHLQLVGDIGRNVLNHSLISLACLLEKHTNKLCYEVNTYINDLSKYLQSLQLKDRSNIFASNKCDNSKNLENIYEDLHWLILVSGHLLASNSCPLIPSNIMLYNMIRLKEGKTDMNVTLQLFGSPQCNLSDISGAEESADHVIRLISAIFRLCEIQRKMIEVNILSPELIRSILWFFARWSEIYLLPVEKNYMEISLVIVQAFGVDSDGAQWCINFLLDYARFILNAFKGEEKVTNDVIELLLALVQTKEKASCVLKSERMSYFMELATKNTFSLPQSAKRGLMSAVIRTRVALQTKLDQKQFWSQTIQPFQQKFTEIISKDNFVKTYQQESIKVQISELLDFFIGIVQGLKISRIEHAFQFLYPVLSELANLLSIYHNYSEIVKLIFELLFECSKDVIFNDEDEIIKMHKIYLNNIQVYARYNTNRFTTNSIEEEDLLEDLMLVMQLISNISFEGFFNFETETTDSSNNVSLYAITYLIPMMTIELLKFPSLCKKYYELLGFVQEAVIFKLPPEILKQLISSLELGIYSFGEEIADKCCGIIGGLAKHILVKTSVGKERNLILTPFINIYINLCQSHRINLSQVNISGPMFFLINCYRDEYQRIMENCIGSQSDPEIQQQLATAFTELIADFDFGNRNTYNSKIKFDEKFEKFIITLRGILIIK